MCGPRFTIGMVRFHDSNGAIKTWTDYRRSIPVMKNGRLDATPLRSRNPTDETPSQPVPKSKYLQEQVYAIHPVF
jgi:hypothetical protein